MTFLSENLIFVSPCFMTQVPERAGLSFLSSADANRPAKSKRPQAHTKPHGKVFGLIMFHSPWVRSAADESHGSRGIGRGFGGSKPVDGHYISECSLIYQALVLEIFGTGRIECICRNASSCTTRGSGSPVHGAFCGAFRPGIDTGFAKAQKASLAPFAGVPIIRL